MAEILSLTAPASLLMSMMLRGRRALVKALTRFLVLTLTSSVSLVPVT